MAVAISLVSVAQTPIETTETFIDPEGRSTNTIDMEQWATWEKEPLLINTATLEELTILPGVNEIMAHQLIEYRMRVGTIKTKYELTRLRSWSVNDVALIEPYIDFSPAQLAQRLLAGRWRHDLMIRQKTDHTPVKEIQDGVALGDNGYGYLRYVGRKGRAFEWGLALEKDHGEALKYEKHWIAHRCGFIKWSSGTEPVEEITAGSFRLSWGQGLALADGYRGGSGPQLRTNAIVRLSGHASSSEFGFQNGIALRGRLSSIRYGVWYSRTPRSIKVDTVAGSWSTEYADGLFRTEQRLHWWHSSKEQRFGAYSYVKIRQLTVGLLRETRTWKTGSSFERIKPLNKEVYSGVLRWQGNEILIASEVVRTEGRTKVEIQTVWVPDDQWKMRLRYRSVPMTYLGDRPRFYFFIRPQGEKEMIAEQWWNPLPHTRIYLFMRKRPEDRRFGFRLNYGDPDRLGLQFDGQRDDPMGRIQGRIQLRKALGHWMGTVRSQWNRSDDGSGALWFIDLQWRPNERWRWYTRWTVYESSDFDHRMYAYENDLLYVFSVPAFYGSGSKLYTMVVGKLANHQLWLKVTYDRIIDWSIQYRLTF